jgi:poly(3-hydroxyoctanoate) depolymerase
VANSLLLAERLPEARLLVAEGEGHLLLLDPQSSVLPAIRDFLLSDEHDASAAWRDGVEVDRAMVDEAVSSTRAADHHPIALLSAGVRALSR